MPDPILSRRGFLSAGTAAAVLPFVARGAIPPPEPPAPEQPASKPPAPGRRLRVAAINSIYRFRSHAYHIAGRFIHGYNVDGFHHQPPFDVVRMFNHQSPKDDLGPSVCKTHGIELCKTVGEALGKDGGLDVDAVLLIIEHGDYKENEFGQILYPRYELFEEVVAVFRKAGRAVPVFVDKHLSYDHRLAAKMVETSREMKFGLMAGSSVPVTWRMPALEPPVGTPFREALMVFGYERGTVEIYLFHALEALQCMLERRPGGETGVKSVRAIQGNAVWKAADEGVWSLALLEAALARCPSRNPVPLRETLFPPLLVQIEYRDGTKASVLNLVEQTSDFGFAATIEGQRKPMSFVYYLPQPPGARFFDPLTWNIEKFFTTGKAPYPVERTLLTSTLCDLAVHSLKEGKASESPALDVRYAAPERTGFFNGPVGG